MLEVILAREGRRCRARDNLAMAAWGGASNCSSCRHHCLPVAMAMKDGEGGQPGVVDLDRGWRGSEVLTTFGSSGREKRKEEVHKKREENIKEIHGMWMVGLNPHGSRGKKRRG
jgi:hypothetical protein